MSAIIALFRQKKINRPVHTNPGLVFLLLCIFLFSITPGLCAEEKSQASSMALPDKLIFMDEPMAPFSIGAMGELAKDGLCPRLLQAIFDPLGFKTEIKLVPFARAIKSVENGRADGMPLLFVTEQRKRYMVFTDPITQGHENFYYHPDKLGKFEWNSYSDIQGKTIGLVRGYSYSPQFTAALEDYRIQVEYATNPETNIHKLYAKRVDLILEDEFIVQSVVKKYPAWKKAIKPCAKPVSSYSWSMGLWKNSPAAAKLDEINQIIGKLQKDGTIRQIFETQ